MEGTCTNLIYHLVISNIKDTFGGINATSTQRIKSERLKVEKCTLQLEVGYNKGNSLYFCAEVNLAVVQK